MSNELGAGRPEAARLATRVVVLLALAVGASEGLAMVLVRNLWGYAYSSEEEEVRHTARIAHPRRLHRLRRPAVRALR